MRPNYATNIETPRAIGCGIDFLDLQFENDFSFDIQRLASLIMPETKLISITTPHNPTGVTLSEKQLREAAALAESKGCYLLVDETYGEMNFAGPTPLAASISPRCISVASVSKSYGLPGIRIGWVITRDRRLQEATRIALTDNAIIPLYWETSVWAFKDRYTYVGRSDQVTDVDGLSLKAK